MSFPIYLYTYSKLDFMNIKYKRYDMMCLRNLGTDIILGICGL